MFIMIIGCDILRLINYINNTSELNSATTRRPDMDIRPNRGGGCGEFVQQLLENGTGKIIENYNNIFITGADMTTRGLNLMPIDYLDELIPGALLCVLNNNNNFMKHYALCVAGWAIPGLDGKNVIGLNGFNDHSYNWVNFKGCIASAITENHFDNGFRYLADDPLGQSRLVRIDYTLISRP